MNKEESRRTVMCNVHNKGGDLMEVDTTSKIYEHILRRLAEQL